MVEVVQGPKEAVVAVELQGQVVEVELQVQVVEVVQKELVVHEQQGLELLLEVEPSFLLTFPI